MPENINPQEAVLQAETSRGSDTIERLPSRIERYGKAKDRAMQMSDYCKSKTDRFIGKKLGLCGNWLLFHHYYTVDKVRLAGANFCKKHLLCPLCAIRRGAKQLNAYIERYEVIRADNEALTASMVTLTVKNGPDLDKRFEHLRSGIQKLNQSRRNKKRGKNTASEWGKVLGLVGTFEVTNIGNEWHPHAHIIVLHKEELSEENLSIEWKKITRDSHIVNITPLAHPDEPQRDFIEVFKYAIKFSSLTIQDNYHAYTILKKKRLIFSAGLFWGVKVPEDLTDERLDDLPFIELFYRYIPGSGYNLDRLEKAKNINGMIAF